MSQIVDESILKKLIRPDPKSHKGQNGRVFVIAGSEKFHGALLLTLEAASRIVDMVYVHSTQKNLALIDRLKQEISVFIGVSREELWDTVELVDTVIVGPGLAETKNNVDLVQHLLQAYPSKKVVVDATAFWHLDPALLHPGCIVTPHTREFQNTFQCDPTPENTRKMAERYHCIVVLKGAIDYISDGNDLFENHTGNVGMTKGGTGDVLAGLIGGLSARNDLLIATLAGVYLNGLAGDRLYETNGTFYHAEDIMNELGHIWKEQMRTI